MAFVIGVKLVLVMVYFMFCGYLLSSLALGCSSIKELEKFQTLLKGTLL